MENRTWHSPRPMLRTVQSLREISVLAHSSYCLLMYSKEQLRKNSSFSRKFSLSNPSRHIRKINETNCLTELVFHFGSVYFCFCFHFRQFILWSVSEEQVFWGGFNIPSGGPQFSVLLYISSFVKRNLLHFNKNKESRQFWIWQAH